MAALLPDPNGVKCYKPKALEIQNQKDGLWKFLVSNYNIYDTELS